jgi:glucan phosphoethanolaminetransferase (alkaline phosphatase superfamily)
MKEQKNYIIPLVGAFVGILLSGAIWGGIAIATDSEIGFVALATGALTGFLVATFAKKNIDVIHQLYAVVASILGIFLGKYIAISYFANKLYDTGYFNNEIWTAYKESIISTLEPMDYLFFALAIVMAWQFTKSTAKKANKTEESASEPSVPQ